MSTHWEGCEKSHPACKRYKGLRKRLAVQLGREPTEAEVAAALGRAQEEKP